MTEQAVITCNTLRTSCIDPGKSAYHQLHSNRYDWNNFPMAPPGTRAVLYMDPDNIFSWGTRGIDDWYCGPAQDQYWCNIFYVPETRSYWKSGSFDLFPHNCSLPDMSLEERSNAFHNKLIHSIVDLQNSAKKILLKKMADDLHKLATSTEKALLQRVPVETNTPHISQVQRVSQAPPITTSTNPTANAILQTQQRTHMCTTRNNKPGAVPLILVHKKPARRSPRLNPGQYAPNQSPLISSKPNSWRIPFFNHSHIISQEAVNLVTEKVLYVEPVYQWTPRAFVTESPTTRNANLDVNIEHFCAPVIHPITGETITKYQKLIIDPVTRYIWSKAFGK